MSEVNIETNTQAKQEIEKSFLKNQIPIWMVAVLILQFILNFYFGISLYNFGKLEKKADLAVQKVDEIKSSIEEINNKIMDAGNTGKKNFEYIERLNISSAINSGYIVTDKIVVGNGRMALGNNVITIDIQPQPDFSRYFAGQGKVNLADRELRAALIEVVNELEQLYSNYDKEQVLPKFQDLEIVITEKGYSIATYKNGKVVLAGEN